MILEQERSNIKMYSRFKEEKIILDFFTGFIGNYLDIGAFDGVTGSNTLALSELGWSGTAIEASPWVFERLVKNYKERGLNQVKLIEAALVPDSYPKKIDFYETNCVSEQFIGKGVGSLSFTHIQKYKKIFDQTVKTNIIKTEIETISISEVFQYDIFDFISIDVEDFNLELLVNIPWHKLQNLKLFCIELDTYEHKMVNFMKPLGWNFFIREDCNLFFKRN